jgi:hypothetical protein
VCFPFNAHQLSYRFRCDYRSVDAAECHCIVDAGLYTVVVCLVMKLQALLSTQKVALHAWGSLSFFFFSFFLKQLYKNIANMLRDCVSLLLYSILANGST